MSLDAAGRGACVTNPIAALDDGSRLVGVSRREALFFASRGPQQHRPDDPADDTAHHAELPVDFLPQRPHPLRHRCIRPPQVLLHGPERRGVAIAQRARLPGETRADARISIVLVSPPAIQGRAADAVDARAVALEIAPEGPVQKAFRILAGDGGVLEIERVLPVDIGQVDALRASVPARSSAQ